MAIPLKIRGICSSKYETNKCMALLLYLLGQTLNEELAYTCIYRELPFVDNLAAHMLIETDIICQEGIIFSLREMTAYVSSYAITLEIDAKQRGPFICGKLLEQHNVIVSTHS